MSAYYNEFDPKTAAWLRELIKQGLIADGIVDERSITDVQPDDLHGFTQCHFFAGIGGWSYALRLSGWPDDCPVWTGSCPCQPFSSAGNSEGSGDSRHLWPVLFALIKKRRPEHVFGEQVARAIGFNWLDGICADLESEEYTVGSAVLGAHSVGLGHHRKRCYWVANCELHRCNGPRVSQVKREGVFRPSGSSHLLSRDALPMPGNAKDFRDFLLLPDGVPNELDAMHAFGNAIVPQVAAEFISVYIDCLTD
jgi:DNA (cytosine-5)-methyltransferase 1